ncbi:MAG: pyridoxamine 5'-phosphate oxidase family protein [Syntrophorhabdaceae bacterium]|nr:pyridoxamine 5'-phosphate oxidase family protein [Syntrophorhabdaceae bacterium]
MTENEAKQQAAALIERASIMMLGTVGPGGAPEIKAMMKIRNDAMHQFWFCSNTSARRTDALRSDTRACLYAYEFAADAGGITVCRGVMLSGDATLSWDDDLRRSFWQDFMKMYYPQGPLDPDFVVVQFTAKHGNYYEGLRNKNFSI